MVGGCCHEKKAVRKPALPSKSAMTCETDVSTSAATSR